MSYRTMFKKGKNAKTISKNKDQARTVQDFNNSEDKQWIGDLNTNSVAQTDPPYYTQYKYSSVSKQTPLTPKHSQFQPALSNRTSKSPTQLIQDILRSLPNTQLNPYYSKTSQQTVVSLLTNKNKLTAYIKQLQTNIIDLDPQIVKNYQILILLLKQIQTNDVQVKQTQNGLQIKFNKSSLQKQQNQIQILEKQLQQKDKLMKQVIQEYQCVIRNFNQVIQKLVQQRDKSKRASFSLNQYDRK